MTQSSQANGGKRVKHAPMAETSLIGSQVISVDVAEDEEVRWHWTHYPDGQSVVTGYSIVQLEAGTGKGDFDYQKAITEWFRPGGGQNTA